LPRPNNRPRFAKASGLESAVVQRINRCTTHDHVMRLAHRLYREGDRLLFYAIWSHQIAKQECLPFSVVIAGHLRAVTKDRMHAEWAGTYVAELVRLYGLPADAADDDLHQDNEPTTEKEMRMNNDDTPHLVGQAPDKPLNVEPDPRPASAADQYPYHDYETYDPKTARYVAPMGPCTYDPNAPEPVSIIGDFLWRYGTPEHPTDAWLRGEHLSDHEPSAH
jgi:hypothetical protein